MDEIIKMIGLVKVYDNKIFELIKTFHPDFKLKAQEERDTLKKNIWERKCYLYVD